MTRLNELDGLASLEDVALDQEEVESKIASLEADLLDVNFALESIADDGGVCRRHVEPYLQYLPDDFPLESFTRSPSAVNLEAATVTLEGRWDAVLVAIAAAIAALIAKLIQWLIKRNKKEKKVEDQKAEAVDGIKQAASGIKEHARENIEELDKIRQRYNEQAGDYWSAFAEMVFQRNNPVIRKLFQLQKTVLVSHTETVEEAYRFFAEVVARAKRSKGGFTDEMGLLSELSTVQGRAMTQANVLKRELTGLGIPGLDEAKSSKEQLGATKAYLDGLAGTAATKAFDIDTFTTQLVNDQIVLLSDWVDDYEFRYESRQAKQAERVLKEIGNALKRVSVDDIESETVRGAAQDALKMISSEVSAVYLYQQIIPKIVDTETRFTKLAYDYYRDLGKIVRS